MTTKTDLLPLPEGYEKYDPPLLYEGQMFNERQMQGYARANVAHATAPLQAEIERLRAEVERLHRILGRIVEGDGDSTLGIRVGTDAFAAAREYLLRNQEVGHEQ